jgi:homoserine dehydrogenase
MGALESRYYVRVTVADRPGVLAQLAKVLGDQAVSIAAVNQKEENASEGTAELVIMTHRARESALRAALDQISSLRAVVRVNACLRVEG